MVAVSLCTDTSRYNGFKRGVCQVAIGDLRSYKFNRFHRMLILLGAKFKSLEMSRQNAFCSLYLIGHIYVFFFLKKKSY